MNPEEASASRSEGAQRSKKLLFKGRSRFFTPLCFVQNDGPEILPLPTILSRCSHKLQERPSVRPALLMMLRSVFRDRSREW